MNLSLAGSKTNIYITGQRTNGSFFIHAEKLNLTLGKFSKQH